MMQNKKALIPLFLVLVLFIASIFFIKYDYICSRLVVPDIVEWKKPSQKTSPIYGDRVVRQYFTPNFNGFFRIGFCVEYREPQDAKIEVVLGEEDTDRELFKELIPLKRFSENKMQRFSFSPLWDSAGKTYYLNISTRNAGPETDLRLLYDTWPFFHKMKGGKLYFGDKELPGELSMVSECRVRVRKSEFLSSWHSFLSDKVFAAFYIGVIIIGLVGLIFL